MTEISAPRRQRRDAAENRAGILAAASRTLASDPHASVDQIARTAGLSRRALYGHFDDRATLVRELIAQGAQRFNAIAERIEDGDSRVALARLAAQLWREAALVQVAAAIALDEAHVEETATALAPLRRVLSGIVRRGQDSGELREDMPGATLSRLIEESARMVVTRTDASSPVAAGLAVRAVLGVAGLGWREVDALLAAHPEVLSAASVAPSPSPHPSHPLPPEEDHA